MLKTHSSIWDGALGVISATEHAIVTPPDALPIRAQPYRIGPFKRQIISDQMNKMLKLDVIALRAVLTLRCYRHIHSTLHNVSH